MEFGPLIANLLNPAVLFFFLGMLAVWLRSDLDFPAPIPKLISLYLLLAIGFKGGVELNKSGVTGQVALTLGAALFMAVLVPLLAYTLLRRRLDTLNAAAVAAAYGSVSAVTFLSALAFLGTMQVPSSGWMVAALALMESPAIVIGVLLARAKGQSGGGSWQEVGREAFFNGSVFLLVGSLVIGFLTGPSGGEALAPFTGGLFKGVLCLFLLEMGIMSARRLAESRELGFFHVGFAVVFPMLAASLGLAAAYGLQLGRGDALLFCVLCASASYIAVPAALRLALPAASPGIYVPMALAITFPFNVVVGLPLYYGTISHFWE